MFVYFVLESSLCSSWTPVYESDSLNTKYSLSIMESNQDSTDNSPEIINRNEKFISNENLNYLHPNGYRMTNQMRWFKVSPDKALRPYISA